MNLLSQLPQQFGLAELAVLSLLFGVTGINVRVDGIPHSRRQTHQTLQYIDSGHLAKALSIRHGEG